MNNVVESSKNHVFSIYLIWHEPFYSFFLSSCESVKQKVTNFQLIQSLLKIFVSGRIIGKTNFNNDDTKMATVLMNKI